MSKTHTETVEGVGVFTWRIPRTMRDEIRIAAEVSRLTEGVETPTRWLAAISEMMSSLKTLTVAAPDGWNLDDMDPLDPATYKKMSEVFGSLIAAEGRFRGVVRKGSETNGPANGGDDSSVVSEKV